jgi:hypothetical protein
VYLLQEEVRSLRSDNATLAGEVEQMNRVASYVGSRVAKASSQSKIVDGSLACHCCLKNCDTDENSQAVVASRNRA